MAARNGKGFHMSREVARDDRTGNMRIVITLCQECRERDTQKNLEFHEIMAEGWIPEDSYCYTCHKVRLFGRVEPCIAVVRMLGSIGMLDYSVPINGSIAHYEVLEWRVKGAKETLRPA